MRPEQIKNAVDKLALSEKLLLVEDIWDSIAADNAQMPLPQWQKRELDRRHKARQQGESGLHDWEDVHAALRGGRRWRIVTATPLSRGGRCGGR